MEKVAQRGAKKTKLPNGDFLKKVLGENMPERKEIDQLLESISKSMPKVAKYLKTNWKPVAIAATTVAVVTLGAISIFGKSKTLKKTM
jgi:hypothetical protein